jgi:hypothetical protein
MFLSHISVEAKLADMIKRHLVEDFIGLINVFVSSDNTSIPVGSNWLEEVMKAITNSQMHLVLSSSESIKRPWIHYEAGAARLQGVPCVALCHSGLIPETLPVPLSNSQGVVLTTAASIEGFYKAVAELIGSNVPRVNFTSYANEVRSFEKHYLSNHEIAQKEIQDDPVIVKPRVVCAASTQFLEMGFKNQIEMVVNAFPQEVKHDRVTTSHDLRQLLMTEEVDIVHIAAFVCPRSGDIYFSEVDIPSGESLTQNPDITTADAFAGLLKTAKTRLVVVGSCESLVLAATLLPVVNVVATRDMVSANMMAKWVETFYDGLKFGRPLSEAFDLAVKQSGAPMRLYGQTDIKIEATNQYVVPTGKRKRSTGDKSIVKHSTRDDKAARRMGSGKGKTV